MPTEGPGTFEKVALELARALAPLAGRLHDSHHAVMLLSELGLRMPEQALSAALTQALQNVHESAHSLTPTADALSTAISGGDTLNIIAKGVPVAQAVGRLIDAFDTIADEIIALGGVPGVNPADLTAFVAALPNRLFETIVVEYFEGYLRIPHALLEFVGIIEKTRHNIGSSDPGRPEFVEKQLRLDRIGALLQSPEQVLRDLYGWGQPTFDGTTLLQRIAKLLIALRVPVTFTQVPGPTPRSAIEVCVFGVSTTAPGVMPPGLDATITASVPGVVSIDLPVAADWVAHLSAEAALGARAGIRMQPPAAVSVTPPSGTAQGRLTAGIARIPEPPQTRIPIVALAGGTGLSAQRIGGNLVAGFRWDSSAGRAVGDFGFEGRVEGGKLIIGMAGSDGFIGKILSGLEINADFTVGLGWTTSQGVYFVGSGSLEIQLPVHISLGLVELDSLTLSVGIDGNRFPIGLTTDIRATLGPLVGVVEQIGAAVELAFPPGGRGDIGPLDIGFKFKPPKGVGLAVDAGIVKGGGYLFFDYDRQEYAGVLELAFAGIVTVKAIGLITTKMPDGSPGFSLLLIISAEFGTGIQLGFGFTLLGVGGLLGLNRTMNLQPLMEGVRTGSINSIMFPENPVANAPKIISDLRVIFPPYPDRFLIGPMVKLGWGTPTLVSVSVGIIIEISGNIAIVGVLKLALPTADAPLIVIQANFAGAIEFDKQRLYFFAGLFESRIVFLTLEGELGLLVAWGGDANFVVSVGGFHPRFNPPPLPFPSPKRIAVSILNTAIARIRTETYFAVTSNTVQFGASTELMFDVGVARVDGHMAFDALFQFSPFFFVIEISAGVSLKVFGIGLFSISLHFSLEGPTPFRAHGTGTLSLFFFDVSADFDITWGESKDTTLPPLAVMPLLRGEFEKAQNWTAQLPANSNLLVSLRKLPETETAQVLHPLGSLRVSQRAVPLDLRIDKVGSQQPSDANEYTLTAVAGLVKANDADEQFAKAQFLELSDADKLSQRAFDPLHGGMLLSSGAQHLGASKLTKRRVRYEQIIIDNNYRRIRRRFRTFAASFFNHFLGGAAVTKSLLSNHRKRQLDPFTDKVQVQEGGYTVAQTSDNKSYSDQSRYFASEAQAAQFIGKLVVERPELHDTLHVIPRYEASE